MPTVWALIIMMAGMGSAGNAAIQRLDFPDQAACEAARSAVLKQWEGPAKTVEIRAVCVMAAPPRAG